MAFGRNDIHEIAALDHAHAKRPLPLQIAETFDLRDEPRHDADRTPADTLGDTRMGRPPVCMQRVAQESVAAGNEFARFSRLRYQDIAARLRLRFD